MAGGLASTVFGNKSAEFILIYIHLRQRGHARQIAEAFGTHLFAIQTQLKKFEAAGVLRSQKDGTKRIYTFDERCPLLVALKDLLSVAIHFRKTSKPRRITSLIDENLMERRRFLSGGK